MYPIVGDLDSAVSALSEGKMLIIDKDTHVNGEVTITENTGVINDARITIGDSDLVIQGEFDCSRHFVFDYAGSGTVHFAVGANGTVYPEWWGIDGADDDVQIQQAIDALPSGVVYPAPNGKYIEGKCIRIDKTGITLKGGGPFTTFIQPQYGYSDDYLIHIENAVPEAFLEFAEVANLQLYCNTVSPQRYLSYIVRARNCCKIYDVNACNFECGFIKTIDRCNSLRRVNLYGIHHKIASITDIHLDDINEGHFESIKLHGNNGEKGSHSRSPVYVRDCSNCVFTGVSAGRYSAAITIDACQDLHFTNLVYEPHTGMNEMVDIKGGSTRIRFETAGLDDTGDDEIVISGGETERSRPLRRFGECSFQNKCQIKYRKTQLRAKGWMR